MLQDKNREEEELLVVVPHVAVDHVGVVEVEDLVAEAGDLVAEAVVVAEVEEVAEAVVVPGGAGVEDKNNKLQKFNK